MVNAIPGGLCVAILIAVTNPICGYLGAGDMQASTISLYIYAIVAVITLFEACHPLNLYRAFIIETAICVFLVCVFCFGNFFELASLNAELIMYLVMAGLCCGPIIFVLKLTMEQLLNLFEMSHKRRQSKKLEELKAKIFDGAKRLGLKDKD